MGQDRPGLESISSGRRIEHLTSPADFDLASSCSRKRCLLPTSDREALKFSAETTCDNSLDHLLMDEPVILLVDKSYTVILVPFKATTWYAVFVKVGLGMNG
jgi:hypothetical protein